MTQKEKTGSKEIEAKIGFKIGFWLGFDTERERVVFIVREGVERIFDAKGILHYILWQLAKNQFEKLVFCGISY